MPQIKAHLMEKNIAINCSRVTVPVLAGWTKKPFGHYAILKHIPLRSRVFSKKFLVVMVIFLIIMGEG